MVDGKDVNLLLRNDVVSHQVIANDHFPQTVIGILRYDATQTWESL